MPQQRYTPEEDRLIKAAASAGEVTALAERLGRKRYNVVNRRTRLLRGDLAEVHRRTSPARPKRSPKQPKAAAPIADVLVGRPDWFDDTVLHTRLRSGR